MNHTPNRTKRYFTHIVALTIISLATYACGTKSNEDETDKKKNVKKSVDYEVKMSLPHVEDAFTQGLVFYNGKIIESTGRNNQSWIAEFDPNTYQYDKKTSLSSRYFGEGITIINNKIYQLTWQSKTGFVYNATTYEKLKEFTYNFEGWGITHDNEHLIISDGTDRLHYFDTLHLKEVKSISITNPNHKKATRLNELEYIEGYVFANQWESNFILKIDPRTKQVVKKYDFSPLVREIKRKKSNADVLNGIAYNPNTKDIWITGKLWPESYIVRLK